LRQIHVESRLDNGRYGFVRKAPPAVEGGYREPRRPPGCDSQGL